MAVGRPGSSASNGAEKPTKTPPDSPKGEHTPKVTGVKQTEGEDTEEPATLGPTIKSSPLFTITKPAKLDSLQKLMRRDLQSSQAGQDTASERAQKTEKQQKQDQKEIARKKRKDTTHHEQNLTEGESTLIKTDDKANSKEEGGSSQSSEQSSSSPTTSPAIASTEPASSKTGGGSSKPDSTQDVIPAKKLIKAHPRIPPSPATKVSAGVAVMTATKRKVPQTRLQPAVSTSDLSQLLKDLLIDTSDESSETGELKTGDGRAPSPKTTIQFTSQESGSEKTEDNKSDKATGGEDGNASDRSEDDAL